MPSAEYFFFFAILLRFIRNIISMLVYCGSLESIQTNIRGASSVDSRKEDYTRLKLSIPSARFLHEPAWSNHPVTL